MAAFEGRALSTTTDASVYHNSALLFVDGVTGQDLASRISFTTNLTVAADDTLDFVVGFGSNGNYFGDTTQVDATIVFPPHASIRVSRVSEVEVCWGSVPNRQYQVDYRSELTTNAWTPLFTNIPAALPKNCVTDKVSDGQPQRYYRVVLLPE